MESLLDFIKSVAPLWVYIILFAGAYIENIVPPTPGDTVVVFGAYLVGIGALNFKLVFFVTTLGSLAGFITMFGLGRIFGIKLIESGKWRVFSSKGYIRVESWFGKYGYGIIVANRFLSGARAIVSFFAGVAHLSFKKVFILAFLSSAIWNLILIYAGSKIGENWEIIVEYVKDYNKVVFTILTIAVVIVLVRWYKLKRR